MSEGACTGRELAVADVAPRAKSSRRCLRRLRKRRDGWNRSGDLAQLVRALWVSR